MEEAFLKCQINQLFEMQTFIEKDFKHLPLEKNLKEKFLKAFENVQQKVVAATEENVESEILEKQLEQNVNSKPKSSTSKAKVQDSKGRESQKE